jgi:hypothetical protein
MPASKSSLELAVISNSRIGALIDSSGNVVWMRAPLFDSGLVLCSLLVIMCAKRLSRSWDEAF